MDDRRGIEGGSADQSARAQIANRFVGTGLRRFTCAHAGCWAHLRRKFYELHITGVSHVATSTVERMSALWAVEAEIRGQDPELRRAARQARSMPIIAALWSGWDA